MEKIIKETVFTEEIKKNKKIWLKGKCFCGNDILRIKSYVKKLRSLGKVISCGCVNNSNNRCYNHKNFKGYGEITKNQFNSIIRGCKTRARKIEFQITIQEIWDLFLKQGRKCALTGRDISTVNIPRHKIYATASLDRIDSNKGYTIDNVWWIHIDVNRMKNDLALERVYEIVKMICENN